MHSVVALAVILPLEASSLVLRFVASTLVDSVLGTVYSSEDEIRKE